MRKYLIAALLVAVTATVADACPAGRIRARLNASVSKVRTVTKGVVTGKAVAPMAAPCPDGKCPVPAIPAAPPVKK